MDGGRTHIWARRALQLLGTALVLGAVTPSAASADTPPAERFAVGSPAMATAQQIAIAQWGAMPCNGQVTVEWGTDDANINARSYWANPTSSYGAPERNVQCRVVFNGQMRFDWPKFCTVLVHELGHLAGHDHTADGADVMSPIYRAPLPACTNTPDPSGVAAPATAMAALASAPAAITTAPAATTQTRRSGKRPRKAGERRSRTGSAR